MTACGKQAYADQAMAREALGHVIAKAERTGRTGKLPVRVYPCDQCPGWHLTAKPISGKVPPWDRDPNWARPT